jgi:predicted transcriptional regulator
MEQTLMEIIWSKDSEDELLEIISIIDQRRNLEEILYKKY